MGVYLRNKIWWIKYYVDGKCIRESSRSVNKADAVKLHKYKVAEKIVQKDEIIQHVTRKKGWVYVIELLGYYKIGNTNRPIKLRLRSLQLPVDPKLIRMMPSNNVIRLEGYLHEKFAAKRVRGEWFKLTDEDVTWIKKAKIFRMFSFEKKSVPGTIEAQHALESESLIH